MPRINDCDSIHHKGSRGSIGPDGGLPIACTDGCGPVPFTASGHSCRVSGRRFAVMLRDKRGRKHGYGNVCDDCYSVTKRAEDLVTFTG